MFNKEMKNGGMFGKETVVEKNIFLSSMFNKKTD
jgi:hypothetical protein